LYEYPSTSKTPEISPIKSVNLTASSFGQKRKLNKDLSLDSIDCDFNVTPLNKVPKKSDSTGKKSSYVPSMAAAFSRILAAPNAVSLIFCCVMICVYCFRWSVLIRAIEA
jgi:hypothetical protein